MPKNEERWREPIFFKREEEVNMKVVLKSTESKKVNIPSKIWKEAGWDINDEVRIEVRKMGDFDGLRWKGIVIEREKDWTEK